MFLSIVCFSYLSLHISYTLLTHKILGGGGNVFDVGVLVWRWRPLE